LEHRPDRNSADRIAKLIGDARDDDAARRQREIDLLEGSRFRHGDHTRTAVRARSL
jgi:hypothetical protein